jgi:hypothetical protein
LCFPDYMNHFIFETEEKYGQCTSPTTEGTVKE